MLCTKFKFIQQILQLFESYNGFGIYLTMPSVTVIKDLWNITCAIFVQLSCFVHLPEM